MNGLTGNWHTILVKFVGWHLNVHLNDGNTLYGAIRPARSFGEAITFDVINDLGAIVWTLDIPLTDIDTIEIP